MKPVIVSGIQPTGNLHIGNYLGAVKNWVDLQNSGKYQCYFFIADYHSLTGDLTAEQRTERTMNIAVELLAAGIDPKKSTLFVQSQVLGHTELAWIFNTITSVGELFRMTQFKSKSGLDQLKLVIKKNELQNSGNKSNLTETKTSQFEDVLEEYRDEIPLRAQHKLLLTHLREGNDFLNEINSYLRELNDTLDKNLLLSEEINFAFKYLEEMTKSHTGLLTYPILQAADILLYHGTAVPVGQDQVQHVELTRDIARWFNNRYGNYFVEPKALLTEIPKVMSLLEPTKKMSKSHGLNSVIELADEPEVIAAKLKKAVTATEGGEAPGVQNLLLLLKHFGTQEDLQAFTKAAKDGTIRYGDLKTAVGMALAARFAEFRTKRADYLKYPAKVKKILTEGAERAEKVAVKTTKEVRKLVGLS